MKLENSNLQKSENSKFHKQNPKSKINHSESESRTKHHQLAAIIAEFWLILFLVFQDAFLLTNINSTNSFAEQTITDRIPNETWYNDYKP